jgi:hypothetical protein
MSPVQAPTRDASLDYGDDADVEITAAAIRSYARLLRAVGGKILLHAGKDGGAICEDRRSPARPTVWRISPDGVVEPDHPYNFMLQAFISARLPTAVG